MPFPLINTDFLFNNIYVSKLFLVTWYIMLCLRLLPKLSPYSLRCPVGIVVLFAEHRGDAAFDIDDS